MADTAVHYLSTLTVTNLHIDLSAFRMDLRSFMPYMKVSGVQSFVWRDELLADQR